MADPRTVVLVYEFQKLEMKVWGLGDHQNAVHQAGCESAGLRPASDQDGVTPVWRCQLQLHCSLIIAD
jgi:hypothetical protein